MDLRISGNSPHPFFPSEIRSCFTDAKSVPEGLGLANSRNTGHSISVLYAVCGLIALFPACSTAADNLRNPSSQDNKLPHANIDRTVSVTGAGTHVKSTSDNCTSLCRTTSLVKIGMQSQISATSFVGQTESHNQPHRL